MFLSIYLPNKPILFFFYKRGLFGHIFDKNFLIAISGPSQIRGRDVFSKTSGENDFHSMLKCAIKFLRYPSLPHRTGHHHTNCPIFYSFWRVYFFMVNVCEPQFDYDLFTMTSVRILHSGQFRFQHFLQPR